MFVYYWNNLLKDNLIKVEGKDHYKKDALEKTRNHRTKNTNLLSYALNLTKKIY